MTNIQAPGPCRDWDGAISDTGYGTTTVNGKTVLAHRHVYEQECGPIGPGLQIDHLCRNRACVNIDHMEAVTQRENILRGTSPAAIHAAQTHCVHGHEFTSANTYTPPGRPNYRGCRVCIRDRDSRRKRGRLVAGHGE